MILYEDMKPIEHVLLHPICLNRGPQGPLQWPEKQFSLERKLSALII